MERERRRRNKAKKVVSKDRRFFIGGGTALVVLMVTAPWLLQQCDSEQYSIAEITPEESIAYLSSEIANNTNLPSLESYGPEKTNLFTAHAYNVYAHITQGTNTETLLGATQFGGVADVTKIQAQSAYPGAEPNPRLLLGKTYPIDLGVQSNPYQKGILVNTEALLFNETITTNQGSSVLTFLAETATHEPFHYDSVLTSTDLTFTARSTFHYSFISGLALLGENRETNERVTHFSTLDELVTRYLHRMLIGNNIPQIRDNYKPLEIQLTDLVAEELLSPLGYTSVETIATLQRKGGIVELIERYATTYTNGDLQEAYRQLAAYDTRLYAIFSRTN